VFLDNEEKRLKIKRSVVESTICAPPGTMIQLPEGGYVIACGLGGVRLLEVQLEGKKTMQAADFFRGIKQKLYTFF
jgi:methionyl-tRNA formyltransferase